MHILTVLLYFAAIVAFALAMFEVAAKISWVALGLLLFVLAIGLIPALT